MVRAQQGTFRVAVALLAGAALPLLGQACAGQRRASEAPKGGEVAASAKTTRTFDFSEDTIDGELVRPDGEFFESRAQARPAAAEPSPSAGGGAAGPGGRTARDEMIDAEAEKKEMALGGKDKQKPDDKPTEVTTWKRSGATTNAARLMIGDREELPLRALQAKVQIDGHRARVLFDLYFLNPADSQYEGTFQLRLPEDASPYFYAFGQTAWTLEPQKDPKSLPIQLVAADKARQMGTQPLEIMEERERTWTEPREARMVPREKAALAYTETVRRRVDPALLEWSGAGVFSARVFPLAPRRVHRIVFGYDVNLERAGDDLEYRLDLPESGAETAIDLSVAEVAPIVVSGGGAARPVRAAGRSHFRLAAPRGGEPIVVRLKKAPPVALVGSSEAGPFFAARLDPELPVAPASGDVRRAVFLVDTSLSSNPDKFNVWLKLMHEVLERNRGSLQEFAVVYFDVRASWWRREFVANTPENVAALERDAAGRALEGASDLGAALREAARPAWAKDGGAWDLFLLSDGSATWGEGDTWALSRTLGGGHALFAYRTGMAGTDTAALSHLARESGGAVFSVVGEAEVASAAVAHRRRPWRVESLGLDGASDLLLAGRPEFVFPGQPLLLVGRGKPGRGAAVVLGLEQGGERRQVRVPLAAALPSDLAARAYGQVAVGQLEDLAPATDELARPYATHFRVIGKTCSLLMLDTEEDYARYGIKPEEDAFVVKSKPAAEAVASVLAAVGKSLGNPKVAFLRWLDGLTKAPGVNLEVPASLRVMLEQLPDRSFEVTAPPLDARLARAEDVPPAIRDLLARHVMDYELITDEAARRWKSLGPADALRALSSLVEENPGDGVLARDVAFSAMELGLGGQAFHLLRRVAVARPWEPQTYRAMGAALAALGNADLAMAYYEIALAGQWDSRFGEFQRIVAIEYLRLLRRIDKGQLRTSAADFARARLGTMAQTVGIERADLIVMITWNTDNTDVDLHVVEPSGEECYYQHTRTRMGGAITQDVTRGYGPEMYVLPRAQPGAFSIRAKYFASDTNRASARTKVYATVIERWGAPDERVTEKVITLATGKDMHDIATVKWGGGGGGALEQVR